MDASAVAAFRKAARMAGAHGTELVLTGAIEPLRARLERGGVTEEGTGIRFAPDLDHGLERCEDALLADETPIEIAEAATGAAGPPASLAPLLKRVPVAQGTVLLRQDEPPGDLYVLAEGRLAIETVTKEGRNVRVNVLRPGAVVGELTFYSGTPHTADVVAETPCVVLTCTREQLEHIETDDPAAAIDLHRWFAATIAGRLSETMHTLDALLD
jgi:SulP family sulfate permease